MNSYLSATFFLACASLPLSAQSSLPEPSPAIEKQAETEAEKNERVLKTVADAAARSKKNMALGKKSEMFKRAQQLHRERATYLSEFAEGKVRPFPNIVKNWENYKSQVGNLNTSYKNFLAEEDSEKKAKLAAPLLTALQPVGPFLRNANHGTFASNILTAKQVVEQEKLMNQFNAEEGSKDGGKLTLLTREVCYTLKNLPMPVQFSAPVGTEVFLFSELGGYFPNKLDYIRIVADKDGLATTSWLSRGDGIADCQILYKSPEFPGKGHITPIVKRLELLPLEVLSPVAQTTTNKATTPAR